MKKALLLACIAFTACRTAPTTTTAAKAKPKVKAVQPAANWATSEEEGEMDPTIPPYAPTTGSGKASQLKARFRGNDRTAAKTSISDAVPEKLATFAELIATLPTDDAMMNHNPTITRDKGMDRVDEEKRNVVIEHAWVYAIKYEADQDWHLIAGTDPNGGDTKYFNTEVAGLPPNSSSAYDTLAGVRQQLADILGEDQLPGPGSYSEYEPFAVTISGSLFYDVDHKPGVVGPGDMKPKSAWEIHPITHIEAQ
jgi:hypothetical protein